jgi:glycosyltransferase involved in cell wall biosynthesis
MDKNLSQSTLLFSIIIPVYNVEKYLNRCLDSILNQECDFNYEVIAIDDCSTDGSLDILEKYELIYSNFKVVKHLTNMKLSIARITGIKESIGDYIVHIDSDDWIIPGGLNTIGNEIVNGNYDVILFNYFKANSNEFVEKVCFFESTAIYFDKCLIKKYFLGTCWNKVVKRKLHEGIIYGQIGINSEEDLIYSVEILLKSKSFKCCSNFYYVYFTNSTSLTKSVNAIDFLYSKPVILKELYRIFNNYSSLDSIRNFVIDYFENWVYLFVFRLHSFEKNRNDIFQQLVNEFSSIDEFEKRRFILIQNSMNNYLISFKQVLLRFGFKISFSMLFKNYQKKIFKYIKN